MSDWNQYWYWFGGYQWDPGQWVWDPAWMQLLPLSHSELTGSQGEALGNQAGTSGQGERLQSRRNRRQEVVQCKADLCENEATGRQAQRSRSALCKECARKEYVFLNGVASRFCGSCKQPHQLSAFHGSRRNCERALSKARSRVRANRESAFHPYATYPASLQSSEHHQESFSVATPGLGTEGPGKHSESDGRVAEQPRAGDGGAGNEDEGGCASQQHYGEEFAFICRRIFNVEPGQLDDNMRCVLEQWWLTAPATVTTLLRSKVNEGK